MGASGTEGVTAQGQPESRGEMGMESGPPRSRQRPCPQKQAGRGLGSGHCTAVDIAAVRGWSIIAIPSGCRQGGVGLKPSVKANKMPPVGALQWCVE